MSVTTSCPSCQHRFSVHSAELGRTARCPSCRAEFEAQPADGSPIPTRSSSAASTGLQAGAPAATSRGGFDAPRGGYGGYGVSIARVEGSWSGTLTGLRLVQIFVIIMMVFAVVMNVINFANPSLLQFRDPRAGMAVPLTIACVGLLLFLMAFVGMCMCCSAPYPTARHRALTTVLLIVGFFVVAIGGFLIVGLSAAALADRAAPGRAGPGALAAAGIGGIALMGVLLIVAILIPIFWILFHVAIGDYFQAPSLRSLAITTLVAGIVLTLLNIGAQAAAVAYVFNVQPVPAVLYAAQAFSFLVSMVIWSLYLAVCTRTLRVIREGTSP
jgi:hypothetical protein